MNEEGREEGRRRDGGREDVMELWMDKQRERVLRAV